MTTTDILTPPAEDLPASQEQTIFEGSEVIVRTRLDFDHDTAVITFTSRRGRPKATRAGFGAEFLAGRKIPAVHVISVQNHWWQSPEMVPALAVIAALRLRQRYRQLTSYGSSMGAHGALIFSGALEVDRVLAFSPQFAIHGRNATWNSVWANDTRGRKELYRFEDGCSHSAEIILIVDPRQRSDMLHVTAIQNERAATLVPVPFGVHPPLRYLIDQRLLSPVVEGAINGSLNPIELRNTIRSLRWGNLRYLFGLSRKLKKRGSMAAFAKVLAGGVAEVDRRLEGGISFPSPGDAATILSLAQEAGVIDAQAALLAMNALVRVCADVAEVHLGQAMLLLKLGRALDAIAPARRAVKLSRANLDIRLSLARVYIAANRLDDAYATVRTALTLAVRSPTIWRRFVRVSADHLPGDLLRDIRARIKEFSPSPAASEPLAEDDIEEG